MGRYIGPVCRRCRREGMKLFLKGERCKMAKCPIERGRAAPGMHGAYRRSKPTDYARQFREKQRLKRTFGLRDGQFMRFFQKAARKKGVTGEILLLSLEMRLDNIVYLLGFAQSRRAARQFVLHKHVLVNGNKADIPSMVLKAGDCVEVKEGKSRKENIKKRLEAMEEGQIAPWLELDKEACSGRIIRLPSRDEMSPTVDEQLVIELCSK